MVNLYGMNPSQLAAQRGLRQVSRILSPSLPLSRVLEAFELSGRRWGADKASSISYHYYHIAVGRVEVSGLE